MAVDELRKRAVEAGLSIPSELLEDDDEFLGPRNEQCAQRAWDAVRTIRAYTFHSTDQDETCQAPSPALQLVDLRQSNASVSENPRHRYVRCHWQQHCKNDTGAG